MSQTDNVFPGPEPETAEVENFQIFSRVEIIALLRELITERALVTIYYNQGEDFLLTNLLAVNPEFEELVFDTGADARQTQAVFASQRLTVVAFIDKIKMQFNAQRAAPTTHAGHDAIRMRLPDSMLRLQRRDYYRVAVPLLRPVHCSARTTGSDARKIDMLLADIGCGGVGVLIDPAMLAAQPDLLLEDFNIELGALSTINATLEVRQVADASRGATRRHRLGCTFVRLPGTTMALVQRYVTTLERDRLNRR